MHANIVPFGKFVKSMISGVCWLKTVRFCYSGYISLQGSVDMLPQFVLLTAVLVCTWVNISCYFSGKKKSTVFFWKKKKKSINCQYQLLLFWKSQKPQKFQYTPVTRRLHTLQGGREPNKNELGREGKGGKKGWLTLNAVMGVRWRILEYRAWREEYWRP